MPVSSSGALALLYIVLLTYKLNKSFSYILRNLLLKFMSIHISAVSCVSYLNYPVLLLLWEFRGVPSGISHDWEN